MLRTFLDTQQRGRKWTNGVSSAGKSEMEHNVGTSNPSMTSLLFRSHYSHLGKTVQTQFCTTGTSILNWGNGNINVWADARTLRYHSFCSSSSWIIDMGSTDKLSVYVGPIIKKKKMFHSQHVEAAVVSGCSESLGCMAGQDEHWGISQGG